MKIKEIWSNFWAALFPSSSVGFSIKNIMAAITHTSLMILTFKNTNSNNLIMVLGLWIGFILTIMGLRTYEKKNDILTDDKQS